MILSSRHTESASKMDGSILLFYSAVLIRLREFPEFMRVGVLSDQTDLSDIFLIENSKSNSASSSSWGALWTILSNEDRKQKHSWDVFSEVECSITFCISNRILLILLGGISGIVGAIDRKYHWRCDSRRIRSKRMASLRYSFRGRWDSYRTPKNRAVTPIWRDALTVWSIHCLSGSSIRWSRTKRIVSIGKGRRWNNSHYHSSILLTSNDSK